MSKIKTINTLIKTTHSCNMRCKYCFSDKYGYDDKILEIDKLKKYIDLLSEKYNYINWIWHGGEPLITPLDYYQEIYDYCKKKHSKFLYSLQTNGTLLSENNIKFFKNNNTNIGLSFDGLNNNKTRQNTNKILQGIDLLHQQDVYPGAIMVVNQYNVKNLENEYKYFKSLNLGLKLNPMFNDGAAKKNNYSLNSDEYIYNFTKFFQLWAYDRNCNINVSTCLELVDLVVNERSNVCTYNSCLGKWLCFDVNGHIYPCDRLCIEEYDLGNIDNINNIDEAFENDNFLKLLKNSIKKRNECTKSCEYYKNCYAGCNANLILSKENSNNDYCYIHKNILKNIKGFLLELKNVKEEDYEKYNPTLIKKIKKVKENGK
jgi:radical SAM domain protein